MFINKHDGRSKSKIMRKKSIQSQLWRKANHSKTRIQLNQFSALQENTSIGQRVSVLHSDETKSRKVSCEVHYFSKIKNYRAYGKRRIIGHTVVPMTVMVISLFYGVGPIALLNSTIDRGIQVPKGLPYSPTTIISLKSYLAAYVWIPANAPSPAIYFTLKNVGQNDGAMAADPVSAHRRITAEDHDFEELGILKLQLEGMVEAEEGSLVRQEGRAGLVDRVYLKDTEDLLGFGFGGPEVLHPQEVDAD